jgi:alanyl-tRNA synthetase
MADEDILPRLKKLELDLDSRDEKIVELQNKTVEQAQIIDELKKKYDGSGKAAVGGDDFTAKTWFWTADVVRSTYIQYMTKKRGHTFWRSCPLLPPNGDETLLFVNSGMVQYKPIFLGKIPKNHPFEKLSRASNSQKCIRAGGKHNDLEDVGRDNYHHTYFEMLGNWSFGDYFKEEAIDWAWDLLTNVYGLPGNRMYATYFEGNEALNMPPDLEAKRIWGKYLDESHILPGNMKDNFWEMGDTGPCGPCSELHFDRIGGRNARELVNMDDPDVLEIWNLVFMQFFRNDDRSLSKLPNKHVDTGMGFERLVSVLQNKRSNYDTDVFAPLFEAILDLRTKEWVKKKAGPAPLAYRGRMGKDDVDGSDTAYRVIADHIRTLTFGITDKIQPASIGRGYVLRRVLRRGVRYGKQFLNLPDGFFSMLVKTVVQTYGSAFPELTASGNMDNVTAIIKDEESSFLSTWEDGAKRFNSIAAAMQKAGSTVVSGKEAANLYQSFGFPVDLTRLMAEDKGLTVDEDGFEKAQKLHQEASKGNKASGDGEVKLVLEAAQTNELEKVMQVGGTDDSPKYIRDKLTIDGIAVQAIFDGEAFVETAASGQRVGLVMEKTPFYAEQGGQVSDIGEIRGANGAVFKMEQALKFGPYVLHCGTMAAGEISKGSAVTGAVDEDYRNMVYPNHTMTHVLNLALRAVLGKVGQKEVDQKGSLCDSEKLRFDFNCQKGLKPAQLKEVEDICNDQIKQALSIYTKVVPLASAKSISTLRAVFGETYPDPVRVVSVGKKIEDLLADPQNPDWMKYSVELCGGTHMDNTSESKLLVLVEESGVAKGIRRIKCLTGALALEAEATRKAFEQRIVAANALPADKMEAEERAIFQALGSLVCSAAAKAQFKDDIKKLTKKVVKYKKEKSAKLGKVAMEEGKRIAEEAKTNGTPFCVNLVGFGTDGKIAKNVLKAMLKAHPDGAFMLVSPDSNGKIGAYAGAGKATSKKLSAKDWCGALSGSFGGRGGGKPENAQWVGELSAATAEVVVKSSTEFATKAMN